jgi:hypothetical protein
MLAEAVPRRLRLKDLKKTLHWQNFQRAKRARRTDIGVTVE